MRENEKYGKKIGVTAGAFDLCHAGHILMFKEAREHCDFLIVFLHDDPNTERASKNKPIMSLAERKIILEGIRYIDEVITYQSEADLRALLIEHKPDIRFIGKDWKNKHFTGDDLPIQIFWNDRSHGFSSSELRHRIAVAEKQKHG